MRSLAIVMSLCILVLSLGGCKDEPDNSSSVPTVVSSTESKVESEPEDKDPITVNPADYGAIPNDNKDDTEAIRSAVYAAAKVGNGSVVQLAKGVYNIDKISKDTPEGRPDALYFDNVFGVSIIGDGTTLLIGDPFASAFGFANSGDITVKGVTIDYAILPWVQGEVLAISQKDNAFIFKSVVGGKTVLDDPRWLENKENYGLIRNANDPRIPSVGQGFFYGVSGNCKKVAEGTYQIGIDNDLYKTLIGSEIRKGSKVIVNNRINSCGAFYFSAIEGDINIENCVIYGSVGTSYCLGRVNGNVKINNCKTAIKSGRWMCTNADGLFAPNINGSLTLTNSLIEGTGDDTINLHGKSTPIVRVVNDKQLRVQTWHAPVVGDTVYVLDHINGTIRGEATITQVRENGGYESNKGFVIVLDKGIPGMKGTGSLKDSDLIVFRNALAPGSVISNNVLRYNRGAGVKANAVNIQITNNTIEYTVFAGITLYDIPELMESAGMMDGVISGNKLKHTAFLFVGESEKAAQISIGARTSVMGKDDYGEAQGYMHRNLTVKNNTVEGIRRNGIYLSSAENVVLENNTIIGSENDGRYKDLSGITLRNVKNVQIKNNVVNNLNPKMIAGIKILEKCKNVSVSGNKFTLASGVQEVTGKPEN